MIASAELRQTIKPDAEPMPLMLDHAATQALIEAVKRLWIEADKTCPPFYEDPDA